MIPSRDTAQDRTVTSVSAARKVYAMLENEGLWDAAERCGRILSEAEIDYSICGGVAVCLHGYQRNAVDLDVIVRRSDSDRVRERLTAAGLTWNPDAADFRTQAGIAVLFLLSGDNAGGGEVKVPIPAGDQNIETIDGLVVLRLSKTIEIKLACGLANMRRTHKDFADVVERIDIRNLDGSFARFLHKSVRATFRELVRRVRGDAV